MKKIIFKIFSDYYLRLNKYIQSKAKRPMIAYAISEILYFIILKLGQKISAEEFEKLDKKAIKRYYELYGYNETLKRYKLSEKVLNEIIF